MPRSSRWTHKSELNWKAHGRPWSGSGPGFKTDPTLNMKRQTLCEIEQIQWKVSYLQVNHVNKTTQPAAQPPNYGCSLATVAFSKLSCFTTNDWFVTDHSCKVKINHSPILKTGTSKFICRTTFEPQSEINAVDVNLPPHPTPIAHKPT